MSGPKSSKVSAEVYFLSPGEQPVAFGPFDAVIHLFEHDYDEIVKFWYGVAEVAVTLVEFHDAANHVGLSVAPDVMHNPANFGIRIHLPDGRVGMARHWTSQIEFGIDTEQHTKIAFVCESALG